MLYEVITAMSFAESYETTQPSLVVPSAYAAYNFGQIGSGKLAVFGGVGVITSYSLHYTKLYEYPNPTAVKKRVCLKSEAPCVPYLTAASRNTGIKIKRDNMPTILRTEKTSFLFSACRPEQMCG